MDTVTVGTLQTKDSSKHGPSEGRASLHGTYSHGRALWVGQGSVGTSRRMPRCIFFKKMEKR